jgi:hypothetical protein
VSENGGGFKNRKLTHKFSYMERRQLKKGQEKQRRGNTIYIDD